MTLLDIKTEVATYFQKAVADFTINGQDLFLAAANHVRRQAELAHDFEFLRKTVSVTVDGVTGGSLATAIDTVTGAAVTVKEVIDCGLADQFGNFVPTDWGPTANNLELQRQDNPRMFPRYPTDAVYLAYPRGLLRFNFSGDTVRRFPLTSEAANESYTLLIECYSISADWTSGDFSNGDVTITGTGTPDYTGTYVASESLSGGQRVYVKETSAANGALILLFDGTFWQLFSAFNGQVGPVFLSPSATLAATYTADNGASGTMIVAQTAETSDTWTTYGSQYLLWAIIVYMNHRFKQFVYRTEGNLPPPQQLRDEALNAFIEWDTDRYTKFRREYR